MIEFETFWYVSRDEAGERQRLRRIRHPKLGDQFLWVEADAGHRFRSKATAEAAAAEHGGEVVAVRGARLPLPF